VADPVEPDLTCEHERCASSLVCFVCETCAEHCALGDPDACWEAHEAWRLGYPDAAFVTIVAQVARLPGRPIIGPDGKLVPPAPRPRWRS
jgi:hypothetical protein